MERINILPFNIILKYLTYLENVRRTLNNWPFYLPHFSVLPIESFNILQIEVNYFQFDVEYEVENCDRIKLTDVGFCINNLSYI